MKRTLVLLLMWACVSAPTRPLSAWNYAGHMVTAAIAYHRLQEQNPAQLAKVLEYFRSHPHYDLTWAEQTARAAPEDRDLVLFMLAARWPDDIRGDDAFDRPTHHYVNFPIKPASAPATVIAPNPPDENIIFGFRQNLAVLRAPLDSATVTSKDRAIALCWLFHLVGDGHQPLHSSTLFTSQFPEGDRGGTRFYVKVGNNGQAISLHSLWDDLVIKSDGYRDTKNRAIRLRAAHPASSLEELAPDFVETDFEKWIKVESFTLAKEAYRDGTLRGGSSKQTAEVLPANYPQLAQPIAERRVVLAGYRLADLLAESVP